MDDPFSQLPKAAVLVYAGVLTAAAGNTALAGQTEASISTRGDVQEQVPVAPTCGPACHTPGYYEQKPVEPEPDPVAPTCGPSCHEGRNQQEAPPPLPPNERKGCAVASESGPEANLALLGLGLSFAIGLSIASRRRNRSSES
jgi:hypothetical protein